MGWIYVVLKKSLITLTHSSIHTVLAIPSALSITHTSQTHTASTAVRGNFWGVLCSAHSHFDMRTRGAENQTTCLPISGWPIVPHEPQPPDHQRSQIRGEPVHKKYWNHSWAKRRFCCGYSCSVMADKRCFPKCLKKDCLFSIVSTSLVKIPCWVDFTEENIIQRPQINSMNFQGDI